MILTPLPKLPKNERDLGKLIVAKGFKTCPKSNKSSNLVTLVALFKNLQGKRKRERKATNVGDGKTWTYLPTFFPPLSTKQTEKRKFFIKSF